MRKNFDPSDLDLEIVTYVYLSVDLLNIKMVISSKFLEVMV